MKIKLLVLFLSLVSSGFLTGQSLKNTEGYRLVENISYRNKSEAGFDDYMNERCRLDLYYPSGIRDFTVVVWFHGGGLQNGNKSVPEKLKNRGIAVVAVNYRLNPRAKCPAYIDDAAASVAWVFNNIASYGGDPKRIIVCGHSAGGYLTLMTGLDKSWLRKYGIDANRIAALVPFSGHTITHKTIRAERGIPEKQPIVDEYAPLYHVRGDAPPLLLITGDRELEMLGRYEENAYLWRMMKLNGHERTRLLELDGFDHGGMASPAFEILLKEVNNLTPAK